ncbi:hypothetical protein [Streptomyces mirabilis]|uniref:hypothetical protein n=1 Tax=Streptomyces mirabilis TaxID=68239 RepID=UPI00369B9684
MDPDGLGREVYGVRQRADDRFEVEVVGREVTIEARLGRLEDARIVIGGHAGVVASALATAATMQLRHAALAQVVVLE